MTLSFGSESFGWARSPRIDSFRSLLLDDRQRQRIILLTPWQTFVINVEYDYDQQFLTKEMGAEFIMDMLNKHYGAQKEMKEADKRFQIAQFIYQVGWYGLALSEPAAQRLHSFLSALHARLALQQERLALLGDRPNEGTPDDAALLKFFDDNASISELLNDCIIDPTLQPHFADVKLALSDDASALSEVRPPTGSGSSRSSWCCYHQWLDPARLCGLTTRAPGSRSGIPCSPAAWWWPHG